MNRKYLNVIVYSSIFGIAYGSFFYDRYTVSPSAVKPVTITKSIITSSTNTTSGHKLMALDGENDLEYETSYIPEKAPTFNERKKGIIKQARRSARFSSPVVYTSTEKSHDEAQTATLHEENYGQLITAFTSAQDAQYAPNITAAESDTTEIKNYFPATNSNGTTKGFNEQSLSESDGSEFLPDGSSQQDLFISLSKNPRVYTIKDYQTADISCAPGYDDSSPHAKLMRGLKGCP